MRDLKNKINKHKKTENDFTIFCVFLNEVRSDE